MICRLGNGFFSDHFRAVASAEQNIGLVVIEQGEHYVYHAEANELTGVGGIKREPLTAFIKNAEVYDFFEFDYPGSTINTIIKEVKRYHGQNIPFDVHFDSTDDTEIYCTELIALAVNNALQHNTIVPTLSVKDKKVYALDDIYLHDDVKQISVVHTIDIR